MERGGWGGEGGMEGELGMNSYRSSDPMVVPPYLYPDLATLQPQPQPQPNFLPVGYPDHTLPALQAYPGQGGLQYVLPPAALHPTGLYVNTGVGVQEPYLHLLLPPGASLAQQQGVPYPRGVGGPPPPLAAPRERSLEPLPSHRAVPGGTGLDPAWLADYRSPEREGEGEGEGEGESEGEAGSESSLEGDRPATAGQGLALEEEELERLQAGLDLDNALGQQLAVWSHRSPDTLALFTPIPGDSLLTAAKFARSCLKVERGLDKVLVLLPGDEAPTEPRDVYRVKAGSAVLLLPRFPSLVTMEVRQLNLKFDMQVQVTMTVAALKRRLQAERGLPVERVELLYRDSPMENRRLLLDYRVAHGRTVFAMLQIAYDIRVKVETFWGLTYHLHVDACMTGLNVIWSLLRRTVSRGAGDVAALFELYLPKHTLVLNLGGQVVSWGACLGLYGLGEGDTLSLSTVGLGHAMHLQRVTVASPGGRLHTLKVSRLDRWSTVALMMHGITDIPVNLIRLKMADAALDFSATIGKFRPRVPVVSMEVATGQLNSDLLYGVPVSFQLGNGITEVIKVSPKRTFRWVLQLLEAMGVANASLHDVTLHGYQLPAAARIVDAVDDFRQPLQLRLRRFPVFLHAPNKTIYKMTVYTQETVAAVKLRIQNKTGLSMTAHKLLCAGRELEDNPESLFFETQVAMRASLFLVPREQGELFLVLVDDWLVKLRLPAEPRAASLKEALWRQTEVPSGSLASIGNFLLWYFGSRAGAGLEGGHPVGRSRKPRRARNAQNLLPLRASVSLDLPRASDRRGQETSLHWGHPGRDPMYDLLLAGSSTELGLDRTKAQSVPDHHHPRARHRQLQSAAEAGWRSPEEGGRPRPSWHYSLQRLHRQAQAQPQALPHTLAPRRRRRKRRK